MKTLIAGGAESIGSVHRIGKLACIGSLEVLVDFNRTPYFLFGEVHGIEGFSRQLLSLGFQSSLHGWSVTADFSRVPGFSKAYCSWLFNVSAAFVLMCFLQYGAALLRIQVNINSALT